MCSLSSLYEIEEKKVEQGKLQREIDLLSEKIQTLHGYKEKITAQINAAEKEAKWKLLVKIET